ncbi:MAG: FG-GAP repeat protein [Alphaproteobacteria bacterium]|nr:FG-GAP repeat protein [Alphaproteobacteria bacterium]
MTLLLLLLACAFMPQDDVDAYLDPDEDGVPYPDDCDDADPTVGTLVWYADADADGYGDPEDSVTQCEPPSGHVADASDCDDGDAAVHPEADEACDGQDQDCDGAVDEAGLDPQTFFRDADGDGFGDADDAIEACAAPEGYAAIDGDCDDGASGAFPGAEPVCGDGLDNDCDGLGDCGLALEGPAAVDSEWLRIDGDGDAPLHGAIAARGDLTGDGVIDLVVGSRDGQGSQYGSGVALLFAGPLEGRLDPDDAAFRLMGEYGGDEAGADVAVGDVDGSGEADVIVGAPLGFNEQGAVYIALGPVTEDLELALSTSVIELYGVTNGDELGEAVLLEDLNDDGADDLLLGAPGVDGGEGAVYFVEGPLARRDYRVDDVHSGVLGIGLSGARLGAQIEPAGDVDGDGRADLLLGAPDLYAYSGAIQGMGFLITEPPVGDVRVDQDFRASFGNTSRVAIGFAEALVGAGDVDGDGYADVLITAPDVDDGPNTSAGQAWLIPGDHLRRLNGEAVAHQGDAVATILGGSDNWRLGASAHSPGDLNGDGRAELLIGAPGYRPSNREVGAMLLFEGPLEGSLGFEDASYTFEGITSGTELGAHVSSVGDLNGLGLPELVVAAPADDGSLFLLAPDAL